MSINIIALRHFKRENNSEEIAPEYRLWGMNIQQNLADYLVVPRKAYVSDLKRTTNTALLVGCKEIIEIPELSFSLANHKDIPWNGDFKAFVESYDSTEAVRSMSKVHKEIYDMIVSKKENAFIVTHESRIESICAQCAPAYASRLGNALGYGEGIMFTDQLKPKHLIRYNTKIREVRI